MTTTRYILTIDNPDDEPLPTAGALFEFIEECLNRFTKHKRVEVDIEPVRVAE